MQKDASGETGPSFLNAAVYIDLLSSMNCCSRGYWIAFEMIDGQKRRPIVEFIEADDFENSGAFVATLKGKGDGGRSMFASGDEFPLLRATQDRDLPRPCQWPAGLQPARRRGRLAIARRCVPTPCCSSAFCQTN